MPTRAGWTLLGVGGLFVLAGRILGPVEFIIVGVAAIAATLLAVVARRFLPSRVAIGRHVSPARVPAGESARVDLELINRNRRRSPLLVLTDDVSGTRGARLSIAPIPGLETTKGAYRLPAARRGILELGPITLDDVDALGLARRSHQVESRVRVVVHPPIEPIPPIRVPAGEDPRLGEELRHSLGNNDDEFDGLREFAPGDDLRRVHWPSTARHDDLLVRQFRPPRHGRLAVVLDTRPPGDGQAAADITTSIAASIAAGVLAADDAVRVEATDGRTTEIAFAPSQLDGVLEFLALLEGGDPGIHPAVPTGAGTVVAVSADPELATSRTARRLFADRLRAVLVVTVDAVGWDADAPPGPRDADWLHLTGPGQLAAGWEADARRRVTA